jgi:hypothetical protein
LIIITPAVSNKKGEIKNAKEFDDIVYGIPPNAKHIFDKIDNLCSAIFTSIFTFN